ncbi:hypothetical protein F5X98DRAFT_371543 [Xylaria grammica]|nr:hypothetical protein F5X98DRAFT_371543 [Xylaria grammica]
MTKPNDVIAVVLTVLILGAFIGFYACVYRVRAAAAAAAAASDEDDDDDEGEDDDGYGYYGAGSSDAFLSTSTDSAQVGAQVPHPEPAVLHGGPAPCAYADPAFASAGPASPWRDRGNGYGAAAAGADTGADTGAGAGETTSAESQSSDPRSARAAGSVSSPQAVDEENPGYTG